MPNPVRAGQAGSPTNNAPSGPGSPQAALQWLLGALSPVPQTWLTGATGASSGPNPIEGGSTPYECCDYDSLVLAWRRALRWRDELDIVLSVMLGIATSTDQIGDQLFLQVIGDPGCGKTQFCDGMLTSQQCFPLEHLTGFHSGMKDETGDDFSLIARINHRTMITPEGDTLITSPNYAQIMSQQRRIFDGTSGATYKNMKTDRRYLGLRTPWIIAGTPALLDTDQSKMGDRFLRICIDPPSEKEKQAILWRVVHSALDCVVQTSDGAPESQISEVMGEAHKMTGAYVNWLRQYAGDLLAALEIDTKVVGERCTILAEFTADMRASAHADPKVDSLVRKELPTRLTHQFVRLACCLAVVLNRKTIDEEVMRRLLKVAMDTSRGINLSLVKRLYPLGKEGGELKGLAMHANQSEYVVGQTLRFLKRINVVEVFKRKKEGGVVSKQRWRLTDRSAKLYREVLGDE